MTRAFFRVVLAATTVGAAAAASAAARAASTTTPADPFAFFAPTVVVSEGERRRLDRDEVISRTLPGTDGQLSVLVVTRLKAQPDALAAWMRAIEELKRSKYVLGIGKFSDPPVLSDLGQLTLDDRDLEDIRDCAPLDCDVKLAPSEIAALKAIRPGAGWRDAVQAEFRRLILARVNAYRSGGLAALPVLADHDGVRQPAHAFAAILNNSTYLRRLPALEGWLSGPAATDGGVESFFYWSKEYYGTGRAVISVTHVGIVRPAASEQTPAIMVAAKQVLATHYVEGALGITAIVHDRASGSPYLVYLNRSQIDLLRGFFSALTRGLLESRLKRDAPQVVRGLRQRLEAGPPPADTDIFAPGR